MTKRTALLTLAVCLVGATVGFAADNSHMGTWKLNETKSKIPPGASKNNTVVYEGAGDNTRVTVSGTDASGKSFQSVWTGKFDGKDYALTGDPAADMRSYRAVSDRKLAITTKQGGKVTATTESVVSADGKTRTVTTRTTNAQGQQISTTAVFDKQ